jgi:thioredoxin-related protein
MINYLLFTSKNCPSCPAMKKTVSEMNLGHFEFSVDSPIGAGVAKDFNVRSLPTFIICEGNRPEGEIKRFIGNWSQSKIEEALKEK